MTDVGAIIEYENGTLSARNTVKLFSQLIKDGTAWTLQGHYGRMAQMLIDEGFIDVDGQIDWVLVDNLIGMED